jgi:hypothetical protein
VTPEYLQKLRDARSDAAKAIKRRPALRNVNSV